MRKILKAVKTKKCIGCGNCKVICGTSAIQFLNVNGFQYPNIDVQKCVSCGRCDGVCPVNGDEIKLSSPLAFYAAYVTLDVMAVDSTSGGICTFASQEVIKNGGIVFSAGFTVDWDVEYSQMDDLKNLKSHAGSKYMQANFNDVQKEIAKVLKKGIRALLIGTPCFVAAVKKYLNMCSVDTSRLLTIDFLCHGIPSSEIAQSFIKSLEKKAGGNLEKYNFRSKAYGWGRASRSTKLVGKKEQAIRADFCPLHTWFGQHLSLRESCFECDFRNINRPSDITVADFWKINKYYPDIPIKQGVSAVQINTEQGAEFYNYIVATGKVVSKSVTKESIWEHRRTATQNFQKPNEYDHFWKTWNETGLDGIKKLVPPQTVVGLIKAKLKSMFR